MPLLSREVFTRDSPLYMQMKKAQKDLQNTGNTGALYGKYGRTRYFNAGG